MTVSEIFLSMVFSLSKMMNSELIYLSTLICLFDLCCMPVFFFLVCCHLIWNHACSYLGNCDNSFICLFSLLDFRSLLGQWHHDYTHNLMFGRKSRKMSPPYRVLLHNDNYNKREYVVQVLMKVIPGMTVDNAVNIMQEAHYNGMSVVIVCGQDDAEEHCTQLRGNGLLSSIEPASDDCCWISIEPLYSRPFLLYINGVCPKTC